MFLYHKNKHWESKTCSPTAQDKFGCALTTALKQCHTKWEWAEEFQQGWYDTLKREAASTKEKNSSAINHNAVKKNVDSEVHFSVSSPREEARPLDGKGAHSRKQPTARLQQF